MQSSRISRFIVCYNKITKIWNSKENLKRKFPNGKLTAQTNQTNVANNSFMMTTMCEQIKHT